eukprot:TRINITY_DN2195_c5_g1_i1.p1 TRINITY_DN2195_c5_g1~~TRINITY_DN2195_c5_g1_i1.p1  ORF type:complete len:364 (+),score=48.49 TRINITY_DN2195_c5_g1_i1:43-1134(+)
MSFIAAAVATLIIGTCFDADGPAAALLKMTSENQTFADQLRSATSELPNTTMILHPGESLSDLADFFTNWIQFVPILANTAIYSDDFDYLSKTASAQKLYENPQFSQWVKYFVDTRGEFMDSTCSNTTVHTWEADVPNMTQFVVPPNGFETFSDFFSRDFINQSLSRPFDQGGNLIPAPCDSVPIEIHDALTDNRKYHLKGDVSLNVSKILGGYPRSDDFVGGQLLRLVLFPYMYHKMHAPFDCQIEYVEHINGGYYDINNDVEEYETRRRAVVVLRQTSNPNNVIALVPLGFATISSIVFSPIVKPGSILKQGQYMAHFMYGGSTVAVLVPKASPVTFTVPDNSDPNNITSMYMGQSLGYFQ